jgi:hypothetical protein
MEDDSALARPFAIPFLQTSAKDSTNVETMFTTMAGAMKKKAGGISPATGGDGTTGVVVPSGKSVCSRAAAAESNPSSGQD